MDDTALSAAGATLEKIPALIEAVNEGVDGAAEALIGALRESADAIEAAATGEEGEEDANKAAADAPPAAAPAPPAVPAGAVPAAQPEGAQKAVAPAVLPVLPVPAVPAIVPPIAKAADTSATDVLTGTLNAILQGQAAITAQIADQGARISTVEKAYQAPNSIQVEMDRKVAVTKAQESTHWPQDMNNDLKPEAP